MRSGKREAPRSIVGGTAALSLALGVVYAPPAPLIPIPAPDLLVAAHGLEGAGNLRLETDGSLVADARDRSLEYRIVAGPGDDVHVLLGARELRGHVARAAAKNASVIRTRLEWPRDGVEHSIAERTDLETALIPDGTLFVLARDSGVLYRIRPSAKK